MPLFILDTDKSPPLCTPYPGATPVLPPRPASARSKIGVNIAPAVDYSPARLYSDMIAQSRDWRLNGSSSPISDAGWPLDIRAGESVEAVLSIDGNALCWPSRLRVVASTSTGWYLKYTDQTRVTIASDGTFSYENSRGGLWLVMTAAGLNSLHIHPVGEASVFFNHEYVAMLKPFSVLRFMDLQCTNNSRVTDRGTPASARTFVGGITPEVIGALCTTTSSDAWVCIPHLATDGYVENFAQRLRASLSAAHTVYVEYSNEHFNSMFDVASYTRQMGKAERLASTDFECQIRWGAKRGAEVCSRFKGFFGPNCVRVLSGQSANPWVGRQVLDQAMRSGLGCDAYAVAPYAGHDLHTARDVTADSLRAAFDVAIQEMQDNSEVAHEFGVPLLGYEGGQHITPTSPAAVDGLKTSVWYSPEMGAQYQRYLTAWQGLPNTGVMCLYYDVGSPGPSGAWGIRRVLGGSNPRSVAVDAALGMVPA